MAGRRVASKSLRRSTGGSDSDDADARRSAGRGLHDGRRAGGKRMKMTDRSSGQDTATSDDDADHEQTAKRRGLNRSFLLAVQRALAMDEAAPLDTLLFPQYMRHASELGRESQPALGVESRIQAVKKAEEGLVSQPVINSTLLTFSFGGSAAKPPATSSLPVSAMEIASSPVKKNDKALDANATNQTFKFGATLETEKPYFFSDSNARGAAAGWKPHTDTVSAKDTSEKAESNTAAAKPSYSFGKVEKQPDLAKPAPPALDKPFSFGSTPAQSAGTAESAPVVAPQEASKPPAFSFGGGAAFGAAAAGTPSFSFGQTDAFGAKPQGEQAAAPAFTFGSTGAFGAGSKSEQPAKPSFSFGNTDASAAAAPPSFSFANSSALAEKGTEQPAKPAFSFGAAPAFGSGAAPAFGSGVTFSFGGSAQAAGDNSDSGEEAESPEEAAAKAKQAAEEAEKMRSGAGEEHETSVLQMRTKLYVLSAEKTWADNGVGWLKVNESRDDARPERVLSRVLFRTERAGKILLNAWLRRSSGVTASHEPGKKDVQLAVLGADRQVSKYLVRFSTPDGAGEAHAAIASALLRE